jgi:hypothetical protein
MSMMDLQGALGGPPGGGPAAIDVPPPEEAAPAGAPTAAPAGGTSIDYLDAAEDALKAFIDVDPDEVDRARATKALQIVLDLKAANQTDQQQGGMKSLARALGGGAGPGGPLAAGPGGPLGGPLG